MTKWQKERVLLQKHWFHGLFQTNWQQKRRTFFKRREKQMINKSKMSFFCSSSSITIYLISVHQPSIAENAYVRMHRLNVVPLLWRSWSGMSWMPTQPKRYHRCVDCSKYHSHHWRSDHSTWTILHSMPLD